MNEEDELCGVPGPGGMTCTMPTNHGGSTHAYEVELPPSVARYVAAQIDRMDEVRERYEKLARRERWLSWGSLAMMGLYVVLVLFQLAK